MLRTIRFYGQVGYSGFRDLAWRRQDLAYRDENVSIYINKHSCTSGLHRPVAGMNVRRKLFLPTVKTMWKQQNRPGNPDDIFKWANISGFQIIVSRRCAHAPMGAQIRQLVPGYWCTAWYCLLTASFATQIRVVVSDWSQRNLMVLIGWT
jgi:hypothetical protein